MSRFWELYADAKPQVASAVDDIRHKLVEEAWFGRRVTGDIGENNAPEGQNIDSTPPTTGGAQHNHHTLYSSVWGKEPDVSQLYGEGPSPATPDNQQQQGTGLEQEL